ncbi:MAG TPA: hypothetical protein VGP08_10545 [Pyrinomonadaceae bacterium]|jgi:hypothetical protein|nr:hypothetical protein [Pyrinomonadaceae bacterium]
MMKIFLAVCCLLLLAAACSTAPEPRPEILGVRLGMSREEAHARLQAIGKLEKEERRQQEVWRLDGDPSYSHLMVAYDKEHASVRYVTAVANEQGRRVHYSDVVSLDGARLDSTQGSRTYTQEFPERAGRPGFVAKAIGTDPAYLKYYSVKSSGSAGEEEDDEE